MRRIYFLVPDLKTASTVTDELLLARIEERHIHIVAPDGTELGDAKVIAASSLQGILLFSAHNNVIQGNYLGTDLAETVDLPNLGNNITITSDSSNGGLNGTMPRPCASSRSGSPRPCRTTDAGASPISACRPKASARR